VGERKRNPPLFCYAKAMGSGEIFPTVLAFCQLTIRFIVTEKQAIVWY
jgi:hypothetical protein